MIFNAFTMHLEYKYITHHHKVDVGDMVAVLRHNYLRGVWQTTAFWGTVKAKPTKTSLSLHIRASDIFTLDPHTATWDRPKRRVVNGDLTVHLKRDVIFQWQGSDGRPLLEVNPRILESLVRRGPQQRRR